MPYIAWGWYSVDYLPLLLRYRDKHGTAQEAHVTLRDIKAMEGQPVAIRCYFSGRRNKLVVRVDAITAMFAGETGEQVGNIVGFLQPFLSPENFRSH